jgi:hypothetical protein
MTRRQLITTGAASAAAGGAEAQQAQPEVYELRIVRQKMGPKVKLFDDYLREVWLPAAKRAGTGPIGVFSVAIGPDVPSTYVLIPHKDLNGVMDLDARMAADEEFRKGGQEFRNAPASDPAYLRIESSLLLAFRGMPKLEVPPQTAAGKPRLFELRTYESHSHKAHFKKIEMFEQGGEIAIFRRTGLQPVFFGRTIVGRSMPNLTYMLVFDDMAARDKNWAQFVADPEWKKLAAAPGYGNAEILTNISSIFLRPTGYSQI